MADQRDQELGATPAADEVRDLTTAVALLLAVCRNLPCLGRTLHSNGHSRR